MREANQEAVVVVQAKAVCGLDVTNGGSKNGDKWKTSRAIKQIVRIW